jgi:formate dehydrogenase subunit delta
VDARKLVRMANEIAAFFESEPNLDLAAEAVANHLKRFWDPRMRREIVLWVDEHGGEGCKEMVVTAIKTHRDRLLPAQHQP